MPRLAAFDQGAGITKRIDSRARFAPTSPRATSGGAESVDFSYGMADRLHRTYDNMEAVNRTDMAGWKKFFFRGTNFIGLLLGLQCDLISGSANEIVRGGTMLQRIKGLTVLVGTLGFVALQVAWPWALLVYPIVGLVAAAASSDF